MGGLEVIVSINNILDVYEKHIYKGCSNKRKLYNFEKYKMRNINCIYDILNSGNYNIKNYNIFLIKYPKYRIVMSLGMVDKVINHYITMYSLIPKLDKYLDNRNIATRKGMGCDYGIKLLKKYIEKNKKYGRFYILKLDIKKYFYNIDHSILKSMLKDKLDDKEYNILSSIIDSTNKDYINDIINKLKNNELKYTNRIKEVNEIPNYKDCKGLPIGNMTSQFLAIYYLNQIEHFIVHNLGIKYMIRYMDDYILINRSKEYLEKCKNIIKGKLKDYRLELNINKCKIYNIYDGFNFLGYKFRVINNKTVIKVSSKSLSSIKRNVNRMDSSNFKYLYSSINNYYSSFKYDNNLYIKRFINLKLSIYRGKYNLL